MKTFIELWNKLKVFTILHCLFLLGQHIVHVAITIQELAYNVNFHIASEQPATVTFAKEPHNILALG